MIEVSSGDIGNEEVRLGRVNLSVSATLADSMTLAQAEARVSSVSSGDGGNEEGRNS